MDGAKLGSMIALLGLEMIRVGQEAEKKARQLGQESCEGNYSMGVAQALHLVSGKLIAALAAADDKAIPTPVNSLAC